MENVEKQVQRVKIDQIKIRKPTPDERTYNPMMARALAESIELDGQLQPVILRPHPTEKGYYENVAGLHRIRAIGEILGWDEIDAYVIECDDEHREIMRAAENVFRTPLKELQFYTLISKWKDRYESEVT